MERAGSDGPRLEGTAAGARTRAHGSAAEGGQSGTLKPFVPLEQWDRRPNPAESIPDSPCGGAPGAAAQPGAMEVPRPAAATSGPGWCLVVATLPPHVCRGVA